MPDSRALLLCEGDKDALFFRQLIDARNLHSLGLIIKTVGGNTGFGKSIRAYELEQPQRYRALRYILIVTDKNDSANQRLQLVFTQIEAVHGIGSRPQGERLPSQGQRKPPIYTLMIPTHQGYGHLESQCINAAKRADTAITVKTENAMAVGAVSIPADCSRRDKAWLRIYLAIACDSDPFIPLGRVFSEAKYRPLIPVTDAAFDGIEDFLRSLPT